MLVEHFKIEDQLEKIAAIRKRPEVHDGAQRLLSERCFLHWRQRTTWLREVRARDQAWRATRTQQMLATAMANWSTWLQSNRGVGAEREARKEWVEAKRLSRSLQFFRDACVRSKHRRHKKVAIRTLRALTQRRPIERAWSHWRNTARHMQSKALFNSWAVAARHQRRIKIAEQAVCSSKVSKLVLRLWKRWRIQAGASSLARLLNAWEVIGPFRRATEILQDVTLEARATQELRRRRLRNGQKGLAASVVDQRRSRSALTRATGHDRLRRLRTGIYRWLRRHHRAQSLVRWQHSVEKARQRATIKIWASVTVVAVQTRHRALAICVRGLERNASRRRAGTRAITAATRGFRHFRLVHSLKRWRAGTELIQTQRQNEDKALDFRRTTFLKQGLESFNCRIQAAKAFREIDNIRSARRARSFSASFLCWRKRSSRSRSQFNLERSASLCFRHRCLTVGLSLWSTRTTYVVGARLNTRAFQLNLGLKRLRRRVENRRVARLGVWRAEVWAEANVAAGAIERWRRRTRAQRDIETSYRIARSRSHTRKMARARCSSLSQTSLETLRRHTQARKLGRRALKAWASHTARAIQASKQARALLLRSGVRRLRLWARWSECRRDRYLKAFNHRSHALVRAKFDAWKSKLFPLGLRVQWTSRTYSCSNAYDGGVPKGAHALTSPELGCIETTAGGRARDSRDSSGYTRLALLRLPMIRRRLRRMFFLWRKQTEKEMRFRYIMGTLPLKVSPSPASKEGLANLRDYLNDDDAAPTRVRRGDEGTGSEPDFKHPGRRVGSKSYLHLYMLSTSHENVLSSR